jgi:hypothetical protein
VHDEAAFIEAQMYQPSTCQYWTLLQETTAKNGNKISGKFNHFFDNQGFAFSQSANQSLCRYYSL